MTSSTSSHLSYIYNYKHRPGHEKWTHKYWSSVPKLPLFACDLLISSDLLIHCNSEFPAHRRHIYASEGVVKVIGTLNWWRKSRIGRDTRVWMYIYIYNFNNDERALDGRWIDPSNFSIRIDTWVIWSSSIFFYSFIWYI